MRSFPSRLLCHALVPLSAAVFVPSLAAQPSAPDPALLHADSLYVAKQYAGAATAYQAIVRDKPTIVRAWGRLGASLLTMHRDEEALDALRHAAALAPANPTIAYNIAAAHARLHHSDSAFAWLGTSIKNGFTNTTMMASDSDLTSLHGDRRYDSLIVMGREAMRPCMHRPESRKFDFWVGEWDVQGTAGNAAGKSSVKLLLEGCALYENWIDAQGGEGKSLNSFNAPLNMWQQFWTDQYGTVTEYRESNWVGNTLEYIAHTTTPQGPQLIKMSFTPVNPDLVRQFGAVSADDGKTWTPSFDLYYHRRKP
ncbi:MAG: hypothetical protein M3081_04460 [Gemmatimonadota bacterium]|nr:hypothetical protein [Gemmatimonadota bacterium]